MNTFPYNEVWLQYSNVRQLCYFSYNSA